MKIEMHCHTNKSFCSNMCAKTILETAKKKGLDGICITDHNSFDGALETEKMNDDPKFKVIKGIEFSTRIGDLIGLFLKEEIRYDKNKQSIKWLINEIHKQKGLVILPHPYSFFRGAKIKFDQVKDLEIDAVEICNGRNYFSFEHKKSLKLAKQIGKPFVVGSDAHFSKEIGTCIIECENPYKNIKDGNIKIIHNKPKIKLSILFNLFHSKINKIKRRKEMKAKIGEYTI